MARFGHKRTMLHRKIKLRQWQVTDLEPAARLFANSVKSSDFTVIGPLVIFVGKIYSSKKPVAENLFNFLFLNKSFFWIVSCLELQQYLQRFLLREIFNK